MAQTFYGPYSYHKTTVSNWNNPPIGVYYCGVPASNGGVHVYYVGQAVGDGGIRNRLLQHLGETKWHDVTHFAYVACDTILEAQLLERQEILRCQPKYNTIGKQF